MMGSNVTKQIKSKRNYFRNFTRNTDGSTAIEFAFLALPFSALLFAIVEIAIIFFISSSLTHTLSESSRSVRLGTFQEGCSDTAESFKNLICENMVSIGNCQTQLTVDLVTPAGGQFTTNILPVLPPEDPDTPNEETAIPPSTYQTSNGDDVVIARARFFHRLVLPGKFTFLANRNGNVRLIQATTAFKNEPFENTCPT